MKPILKPLPIIVLVALLGILGALQPGLTQEAIPAPQPVQAQSDAVACDGLVTQALELVADTCVAIGTNQLCYGYDTINATLNDPSLFFDRPGDIVPVTALETLNTGSINTATGEWGIALMDVQADLAVADGSVRILLFGGAELSPANDPAAAGLQTCTFTNDGAAPLNLRGTPTLNARVTDVLGVGSQLQVYGTTAEGDWLRSARGWVQTQAGTLDCETDALTPLDSTSDAFVAPMQAMTLRVDEAAQCESIPAGMLIQTPDGQTASLLVNGVEMQVGSTALLTHERESGCQTVHSFNGDVDVVTHNTPLPVGGAVRVPGETAEGRECFGEGDTYRPAVEQIGTTEGDFVPRLTAALQTSDVFDSVDVPDWELAGPDIDLTANGSPAPIIIAEGECAILEWTVTDAATAALNGRNVPLQGAQEICPTSSNNYVLYAVSLRPDLPDLEMLLRVIVRSAEDLDATPPTDSDVLDDLFSGLDDDLLPSTSDATAVDATLDNLDLDYDGDGVPDVDDNCPDFFNPEQEDSDFDFIGDACDTASTLDFDGDGISDLFDICPTTPNPEQRFDDPCLDDVGEGFDSDGDGIDDFDDNCPDLRNPAQLDRDGDGVGNACEHQYADFDTDGDGIDNIEDNCPFTYNPGQGDLDDDGRGDACADGADDDFDGDGIDDFDDNCPETPNPNQRDRDNDGIGDACAAIFSADRDDDGVPNVADNCPFDFNPGQRDSDGDGFGDRCDEGDYGLVADDVDGDGWLDFIDRCPEDPGFDNGCPAGEDGAYDDRDGDGWFDFEDDCPALPGDDFGCPGGVDFDADRDGDGWFDHEDDCPDEPGDLFGCPQDDFGFAPNDIDGDSWLNFEDECPEEFGLFRGCPGEDDRDGDGDGFPDSEDFCPFQPGEFDGCPEEPVTIDEDGDPVDPEDFADRDGDGWMDADDDCPDTPGALFGCPGDPDGDTDDDGFPDVDDTCPDTPGPVDGCPEDFFDEDFPPPGEGEVDDRDGDGWLDDEDDCPDTPGPDFGCPPPPDEGPPPPDDGVGDRDGDGWLDDEDDCPDTPGPDFGCPPPPDEGSPSDDGVGDRDGDGWFDDEDDCPDTPGPDFGCPPEGDGPPPPDDEGPPGDDEE